MSLEQREQIERAIEELSKLDIFFQEALSKNESLDESLFVKNLESVQGDERDVIFISCTYGPAEVGGQMHQRFGPINGVDGWRRLNVLFTRSKKRMHVFSSMDPGHILISEKSSRGVNALRGFIEFAQSNGKILDNSVTTGKSPDSDFEIDVANRLRREGFECEYQVGVAGYFIDIAVKDPNMSGRYLAAIECDGATYHSAKSVRDRDRLRQSVLEQLGWKVERIWSTDWFKNSEAQIRPIIQRLNEIKSIQSVDIEPEIHIIAKELDLQENKGSQSEYVVSEVVDLKSKLMKFNQNVVVKALPNTIASKRLLSPAMIDALVEFEPISDSEFREQIPAYLRQGTNFKEREFLPQVFGIIESSLK